MHPAIFIGSWLLLGVLFALQDYAMARAWEHPARLWHLLKAEGLYFLLWGVACQILWWGLGKFIQDAALGRVVLRLLPLSIAVSIVVEALWVIAFPQGFTPKLESTYWQTLTRYESAELVDNLVIFWAAVSLFRSIGYYQRLRQKENATVRLQAEMTNAQLRALRMQLNPHFLFNTMNSVSSLMRSDIEAADRMLERMSRMLRMALERGDAQLIPLTEEIEFIQLYLSIQKMRFCGTVHHYIAIEPDVLDALVPPMILQPLVENAYQHGVARAAGEAFLGIEAQNHDGQLRICVRNSGNGIARLSSDRKGVGLNNVRARLELQYGDRQRFELMQYPDGEVQAIMLLPLQMGLAPNPETQSYRYGD